ncbi:RNA repair domain-containing protein [Ignisphaera sp. 4213-co]|uniref:UPF0248 protein QPL79_02760 n=1 Tax=Ignisphaera cupida TaxID=3050454 RepID=A0ABD4Z588_9CREN|nr:RNA repair domain-containing protein [Ignisphaera sp. 4213-co]MDK6028284.1 RNA repair domain-containing protein [Ignisphaera sp. 4213-co]
MRIKDIVNKILWSVKNIEDYYLVVIDRIDETGFRKIPFSKIVRIDNNYVYVIDSSGYEHAIPIHRIVKIVKNNEIIFERKNR